MKYSKFSTGWMLLDRQTSLKNSSTIAGWNEHALGNFTLFSQPDNKYLISKHGDTQIICFGLICNVYNHLSESEDILRDMTKGLNEKGFEELYHSLIPLGGSFVLIIKKGDNVYVILDASGSRPACFFKNEGIRCISSHPTLIGKGFELDESEFSISWRAHPKVGAGGRYYPGLKTMYENVLAITPNQIFCVNTNSSSRWYPFRDLPCLNPDKVTKEISPLLKNQFKWLVKENKKLYLSLSGGVDTRLTLASSKDIYHSCTYFTYFDAGPVLNTDVVTAQLLSSELGLRHKIFPSNSRPNKQYEKDFYECEGEIRLSPTTLFEMHKNIPQNCVHVRSNILEAGRGFYLKNKANHPNRFDAEKLSRLFRNSTQDLFVSEFQEFIDETHFAQENFFNYHYSDLYYMEHRLACNYGPIFRGHAGAFETYSLYNSYAILELLLSIDMIERSSNTAILELIKYQWPETLNVPIFSGSKFLSNPLLKGSDDLKFELELKVITERSASPKNFRMYVNPATGVPISWYGTYKGVDIGLKSSILSVAERGLYYWNKYLTKNKRQYLLSYDWENTYPSNKGAEPKSQKDAAIFMQNCADALITSYTEKDDFSIWYHDYPFPYNTPSGWCSAHSQAAGILLLALTFKLTNDERYLAPIKKLSNAFSKSIEEGSFSVKLEPGSVWYEKISSAENDQPRILNGMMMTLLYLYETYKLTKDEQLYDYFLLGLTALKKDIKNYDTGSWSLYDKWKKSSRHYHELHIVQLVELVKIEPSVFLIFRLALFKIYHLFNK